jgi:hypothetical protein
MKPTFVWLVARAETEYRRSYADAHVKWVLVTTAWRVLSLRIEERPPAMESSCEYIE